MLTHDLPSEVAEPYTGGLPSVGVFPNPCAADQLNVRSSSRGMLSIYDAMGRICLTHYQHQPTVVCDVAHWPSGMYTVVFDSGQQRMIAKWMKQ
jgi:hypothetical protein